MNIVVTCGHPYSGFQAVHALLTEAGLAQASVSRREGMDAREFHQRVLAAHGVDLALPESLAPVTPGRVWEDLAVDLFLGNLDAPDWGWADPGAVWLLDFWSQFDPQIRFVLVYATPELVVGEMLRQGALSPEGVADAIASWVTYHLELLRFFHRHRDRCILLDSAAATSVPRELVTKVTDVFHLGLDPARAVQDVDRTSKSVLAALLAGGLLPPNPEAAALHAELEGVADIASNSDPLLPNPIHAWSEYEHLLATLDRRAEEVTDWRQAAVRLEREVAEATRRADTAAEALTAATAAQGVTEAKRAEYEAKAAAATVENELLRLQLHEMQVELEQYYLRCQALEEVDKLRQGLEAALATERARQAGLTDEIKRLQARVTAGEAVTKQLAAAQKEVNGQVAARKQAEQRLAEAARRTEDVSRELIAARSAHSATETKIRQQADAALDDERAKQAALAGEIRRLQVRVTEGEAVAKQLAARQKEVDRQVAARNQVEQLLAEATRRTEDISRELVAAKSAHSATEEALRHNAAKEAALTQENESLLLKSQQQLAAKQKEFDGQVAARKQADQLLAEAARRTEDLTREIIAAKSTHSATEKALRQETAKKAALTQENELLLAQLQQVQDELKRHHLQSKRDSDLRAQASLPSGVTLNQLTQATIDLRGKINGDNWYDAEQDGRWAGPGQVSTLVLPALTVGQYQLALEVVDAIEPEVLNGMTLSLNGNPLAIKRRRRGSLTLVTAKFSSKTSTPGEKWKLELSFPRLLSPAERGSDDDRTLAVRVRTLSIVPIGTASDSPVADASASGKWGVVQPTQITFDLRGDIDGDNWYDAEHDGRWAGPNQVSSLILPALGVGRYQMELEVVDAMAPEIVNGMTLSLNGTPITVNPKCRGYPTLVTAEFSADTPAPDGQWELSITFPRLESPADHGSGDHRTLAARLRTISVKEIRPGEDLVSGPLFGKMARGAKGNRKSYRWWGRKK